MSKFFEVNDLCFSYYKSPLCIKDVSFSLSQNSKMLILARKDEGKTTILKVLSGFDETYFGSILLKGKELKSIEDKSRNFSLLPSTPVLLKNKSIKENLDYLCEVLDINKLELNDIEKLLASYQIDAKPCEKVKKLSLIEQRKLAVLRSQIKNPDIIFLDDQFEGLSEEESHQIMPIYDKILKGKTTAILALGEESFKNNRDLLLQFDFSKVCYLNLSKGVCFENIADFEQGFTDRDIFKFYSGFSSRIGEVERNNDAYFFVEENGKHRKFNGSFADILGRSVGNNSRMHGRSIP